MTTEFPIIRTERLLLRQLDDDDIQNVFKGLSHPETIKYYGVSYQTLEATKLQLEFFKDLERNKTGIWWAICSLDNQTFFGAGGLNNVSKEHKKAEIGFWLNSDFWRLGIMTEAMPLICNYAFETLGLHIIEGFVETENMNCKKAMAKVGFTHEGTMQDCEIKNGRLISLDIFAKLKNDLN